MSGRRGPAQHVVVVGGWAPSLLKFRGPLLAALRARGHRVTAMAADGTAEVRAGLAALGVDFEDLALERAGTSAATDLATVVALTRRLRVLSPDVFLGYTAKPVIYGGVAARLARVPRRYALVTGLGYAFLGQDAWRRRALRRVVATMYRASLSGCDRVFLQNADDLAELRGAGALPARTATTIVRGSGVDVDHYAPAPWPDGPPVFLFVGRLLREKGIAEFVAMARAVRARHPEARFRAVGWRDPNPASVGAAELAAWTDEGVLEYAGELADVRPALAAAHVLVLPSYREGTPRSVLEAMSMARPVITTDVPGCRDTIVDGEHGYLVPARDPAALAGAAERLLADPARAQAMGQAARARILALYDARAVAAAMLEGMEL